MRLTVLPWLLWALIIGAVIAFVFHAGEVQAEPLYKAPGEGVEVILHSEECRLDMKNLKRRATWTEGGLVTEGCYGIHPDYPIVLLYFADRSVVILLVQQFQKVSGV